MHTHAAAHLGGGCRALHLHTQPSTHLLSLGGNASCLGWGGGVRVTRQLPRQGSRGKGGAGAGANARAQKTAARAACLAVCPLLLLLLLLSRVPPPATLATIRGSPLLSCTPSPPARTGAGKQASSVAARTAHLQLPPPPSPPAPTFHVTRSSIQLPLLVRRLKSCFALTAAAGGCGQGGGGARCARGPARPPPPTTRAPSPLQSPKTHQRVQQTPHQASTSSGAAERWRQGPRASGAAAAAAGRGGAGG